MADEGGWGPLLPSNETALQIVTEAIERAGYRPEEQLSIALDVAASHFENGGKYTRCGLRDGRLQVAMVTLLEKWTGKYPIASIEDGSNRTTGRAGEN